MDLWELIFEILPQVLAARAAIKAKGGHGKFELDLNVKDTSTGQDIIQDQPVATITL